MAYKMNFEGSSVVVTGAASGIGAELVRGFLDNGAAVYMVDLNGELLCKKADEYSKEYPESKIYTVCCDLTSENGIEAVVDSVKAATGRVDVLVNNAGAGHYVHSIDETRQSWDKLIGLNLDAQFFCAQAIAKNFMIPQRSGKIVNMCSLSALIGVPNAAAYSASKGAVMQMTRALAGEWARFDLRVNCVCPGFVDTPLLGTSKQNEKWLSYMHARIPLKRLAQPEDIVGPVLFLSSSLSDYVNGSALVVDGGYSSAS